MSKFVIKHSERQHHHHHHHHHHLHHHHHCQYHNHHNYHEHFVIKHSKQRKSWSVHLPSFAQITNRETRQHCGSHIYSDERKRVWEGTQKGPSHNFVLKLNITPGKGVFIFIFWGVFYLIFSLNPISHLGLQRCTSFSLFLQRHRYTTANSKQKKSLKLVLPRVWQNFEATRQKKRTFTIRLTARRGGDQPPWPWP